MTAYIHEKRHYPRIIFHDPRRLAAFISRVDEQDPEKVFTSSILNMSEGGIQISLKRDMNPCLHRGKNVILDYIGGLEALSSLSDIPMHVIWIMDNAFLEHVLVGMAFEHLPEQQRKVLRDFVADCMCKKC
jgi:hypothetical protein